MITGRQESTKTEKTQTQKQTPVKFMTPNNTDLANMNKGTIIIDEQNNKGYIKGDKYNFSFNLTRV